MFEILETLRQLKVSAAVNLKSFNLKCLSSCLPTSSLDPSTVGGVSLLRN